MKAIVYREYGPPSVLKLTEREQPRPTRDKVLIRVHAAGINPIDARLRSGEMKWLLPGGFPRIPGYDVSGVIEEAGSGTSFQKGERVLAFLDHLYGGGYADYAVCSASSVTSIPDEMRFADAAALPLAGSTALQSLRDYGHLESGMSVLVNGASGGVGAFAVQIAVAEGAEVTGVASGKHEGYVRSLDVIDFLDYHQQDFAGSGKRWDLIFDAAGKSSFEHAKKALTDDGTYVSTEPTVRGLVVSLVTLPAHKQGRIMLAQSRKNDLTELVRLWSENKLNVTIAREFPLEKADEAHAMSEEGGFCGKLVLNAS